MTKRVLLFVIAAAVLSAAACGPAVDPAGVFATNVHPIFLLRCGTCHSVGSESTPYSGPGDFGDEDIGVAYSAALEVVEAGDPDESALFLRVSGDSPSMPPAPGEPLSDADLSAIEDWIRDGANAE